jgi:hypothetical protein
MGNLLCAGNYSLFLKTSLDRFNLAIGDHEDNIDPCLSLYRALYTPCFSHAVGTPAQASQRRVFYLRVSTRRVSTHRSSLRRGFSTPFFLLTEVSHFQALYFSAEVSQRLDSCCLAFTTADVSEFFIARVSIALSISRLFT